ncbi:MAG: hypothetical protein OQK00_06485 [Rhodobacteraceae bacterium]|nr:hypothetical protein [Paracoccaceae bacterium]
MIRLLFLLLCLAPPALAGPWLRAEGTGFSAASTDLAPPSEPALPPDVAAQYPVDLYNSIYVEYGLTPRLTVGIDGGSDINGNGVGLVFLRIPLFEKPKGRAAAEFAVGARWSGAEITPIIRPGLSWGRGLTLLGRDGWTSVDASLAIPGNGDKVLAKLDAMLGLNAGDRMKLMLGLTLERPAPTLSPSIALKISKTLHLTLGLKLRGNADRSHGLTLGIWQTF